MPAPTHQEVQSYIGRFGRVVFEDELSIPVEVIDARSSFGRVDILIRPTFGDGQRWIQAFRFEPEGR